jgi:hypothetical protein
MELARFLRSRQLGSYFKTFYATLSFITVLTRALHRSPILSQINPVYTTPSGVYNVHFNIIHQINVLVFVVVSFLPTLQ